MHGFPRRSLLAFCLIGGSPAAYAFDCAKAYLPVDFVICSSPAVFRANEAHEKAWYETRPRLTDAEKQELLADQRRWLKEYPPRCGIPAQGRRLAVISKDEQLCVSRALEERTAFLQQYHSVAAEAQLSTETTGRSAESEATTAGVASTAVTSASAGQNLDVLYESGANKGGFESWPLTTPDWKRLKTTLLNDGTRSGSDFEPIIAPYSPETADYVVEAKIRVIQPSGNSFGIVVRADGKDGYAVGVGAGWGDTPKVCYLSGYWNFNGISGCNSGERAFKPDKKWHTYRVEAKENVIKLSIDGSTMTIREDNRFLSPGHVGLWCNGYQLEVQNFKVIKLVGS